MKYWLIKSEPHTWSWQNQLDKNIEGWDGVRNYQARNYLKDMKIGDIAFFYHSVKEKSVVGLVKIVKEHYIDPTDETKKFVAVDIKTLKTLNKPVCLMDIKNNSKLQHLALLKQSRLSVMPIDEESFFEILIMAETQI
jgi:predicted RNA-binding protein with PUA-like domain